MSVRNLQSLFAPKSIALIGASQRPGSVGQVPMKNLLGQGFAGPVLPVNPNEALIASRTAYNVDALLVLNCPTAIANSSEAARAVLDNIHDTRKPVLTSWLGGASTGPARAMFRAAGVPSYDTPTQAVRAFGHMLRYRRNQDLLMQTPAGGGEAAHNSDCGEVREIIDRALHEQREWLSEAEAKCVLVAYGVPVVQTRVAKTPDEAGEIASAFGGLVALKIMSRDITHKSDAGGVALGLEGADMDAIIQQPGGSGFARRSWRVILYASTARRDG